MTWHIVSHLVAFPRRWARSARRGRWHRTCWWSALWSSTACPWPGQTQGTSESSPPCPDWPAPSCSSLPGTDPSAGLEKAQTWFQKHYQPQGHVHYSVSFICAGGFNLHKSKGLPGLPNVFFSPKCPIIHSNFVPSLTLYLTGDCRVLERTT